MFLDKIWINSFKKYQSIFFLILILIIGFFLILNALFNRGPLWDDEIISLMLASPQRNFSQFFDYLLAENSPPIFYIMLRFWLIFLPQDVVTPLLLPVIISFMSIVAIYLLGKEIFSDEVGLLAALLTAVSVFVTYYGIEVRMYILVFLLTTLSIYFFWRYYKKEKLIDLIYYFIFSLLLVGSHLQGLFVILAQDFFIIIDHLIFNKTKPKVIWRLFFSQIIIGLIFLIWFVPFLIAKFYTANLGWYFYMGYDDIHFFRSLFGLFLIFNSSDLIIELLIYALIFLYIVPLKKQGRKKWSIPSLEINREKLFILTIFLVSLIFFYYIYTAFNFFMAKYFLIIIVPFFIILAKGLEALRQLNKKLYRVVFFLFIFIIATNNLLSFAGGSLRHDWDKIAEKIERNEGQGDKIISENFFRKISLQNYYRGNLPVEGFYPLENDKTEFERYLTDNWKFIVDKNNVIKLEDSTQGFKRIFLISDFVTDQKRLVYKWFIKNKWELIEQEGYNDGLILSIFSKESANKEISNED